MPGLPWVWITSRVCLCFLLTLKDVPAEAVDTMFDVNVKGALNVIQAVIPGMKQRNTGHIINISSIAGKETYAKGGVYSATKHAVDALTRTLRVRPTPFKL